MIFEITRLEDERIDMKAYQELSGGRVYFQFSYGVMLAPVSTVDSIEMTLVEK